jgi:5'-3' exonuclease
MNVNHSMKNKRPIQNLIVDANNLLHRVHWVCETRGNGVNVVYLFLNSIKKYVSMFNPDNIYMAWDKRLVPGFKNFRKTDEDIDYKGNRDQDRNKRVYDNEDITQKVTKLLGIKNVYPGVMEGDDIIAWLCENLPGNNVIVSVDQDFLQLVQETVSVYSPIKDIHITNHNFSDLIGVDVEDFLTYKALIGDKSDNIPGLPKVGEKTAKKILKRGIDTLNTEQASILAKNLKLMNLREGYNVYDNETTLYSEQVKKLDGLEPDMKEFEQLCYSMNIRQVVSNINEWKTLFTSKEVMNNIVEKLLQSL